MAGRKLECVVVCSAYSDFLAWCLPTNRALFDQTVVVTTPDDVRTQKLCEYWYVRCVPTDVGIADGKGFNKGKMINAGLDALDGDGWVAHLDADIFLPPLFRRVFDTIELDEDGLYHLDRMMCDDFAAWVEFWCAPPVCNEDDVYVHPRPFPLGVRLAKPAFGGWLPLGYAQIWNQGRKRLRYPDQHSSAARTDLQFTTMFPRPHRHMLAEVIAIHLETRLPAARMGANWNGRRTPPFGPVPVAPPAWATSGADEYTPDDAGGT